MVFAKGNDPDSMVKDLSVHLLKNCEQVTGKLLLPDALLSLEGENSVFEAVTSAKIQTAVLQRCDNVTVRKIALIFLNDTSIRGE